MVKCIQFVLATAILLGMQGLATADYYILWNGQDLEQATIQVGQTATVSIGSTDTTAPPCIWWGYGLTIRPTAWNHLYVWTPPLTIYKDKAGASANVYAAASPYEEQFSLYGLSSPISAGVWCENTFTPMVAGSVTLQVGRGISGGFFAEDSISITITPAVVPDEPLPPLVAQWEGNYAVVEDGDKVVQLTDQSGNGYHMYKGLWYNPENTVDYRPTLIPDALNGHDVVAFDGAQFMHYYDSGNGADENWHNAQGYTWFVVYRADLPADMATYAERAVFMTGYNDIDASEDVVKFQANGWGMKAHVSFYGANNYYYEDQVATKPDGTLAGERVVKSYPWEDGETEPVDSGWRVAVGMWTPAAGPNRKTIDGEVDGYLNFGKGAALTWGGSGDTGTTTYLSGHNGTHLGINSAWLIPGGYAKFLTGDVAEVRVYKGGMNLKNRRLVTQHLRMKYGLDVCTDSRDLNEVIADWLKSGGELTNGLSMVDFTLDGKIDLADFAAVALRWLGGTELCFD